MDFRKNDGYKNLIVVVQGHSGDTVKGYTQAQNRGDGSVDKNGLGALNQLNSKDTRVIIFDSSQNENTKDDINSTITSFNKNHPNGNVATVGHSLGGDNLIEKTNENKDLKVNLMITLDIMDYYSDTEIKSENVSKVVNYYQKKNFYGGEKVTVSEDNNKTKVTNVLAPNSTHKSIDNDLSKKLVETVKEEIKPQ